MEKKKKMRYNEYDFGVRFITYARVQKERMSEVSKRKKHKNDPQNNLTIHKDSKKIMCEPRELPRICRFCVSSHSLYYGDTVLCDRRGIVSCEYCCSKFVYDPLKHQPVQVPNMLPFDETIMSIDDLDDACGHPVFNERLSADSMMESSAENLKEDCEASDFFDALNDIGLPELVFTSHKSAAVITDVSV